jgi:hypothetical protein
VPENQYLKVIPPKRRSFEDQLGERMDAYRQQQQDSQWSYDYPKFKQEVAPPAPRQGMPRMSKEQLRAWKHADGRDDLPYQPAPLIHDPDGQETGNLFERGPFVPGRGLHMKTLPLPNDGHKSDFKPLRQLLLD